MLNSFIKCKHTIYNRIIRIIPIASAIITIICVSITFCNIVSYREYLDNYPWKHVIDFILTAKAVRMFHASRHGI